MDNPLSNIDGDLLRQQSVWLDGRLRNAELSDSADAFIISGLVNLLDEIRSYCHDENGLDCLLHEDEPTAKPCDVCGSPTCHG